MKHIFLTGEIQIGKSTVIQKTLAGLNVDYGGFRTYFSRDRAAADRRLYIRQVGQAPCFDEAHMIAQFYGGERPPRVFPEGFDTLGTQYILDAASSVELIVMDELGDLERNARRFQTTVLNVLESETPVLGVIKLSAGGWVEQIRRNPKVTLVTVNIENRDALPERVLRQLRADFPNLR